MRISPPPSIERSHQEILRLLVSAQNLPGKTGSIAENLARSLNDHMTKEEELVLPLLGMLSQLDTRIGRQSLTDALRLSTRFEAEYAGMLEGHRRVARQLSKLRRVADEEGHLTAQRLADLLELHVQVEEEVLYPAALLVGRVVRDRHPSRGAHPRRA